MKQRMTVVAAAASTLAFLAAAAPAAVSADSGPSCAGQVASTDAGPRYGLVIAGLAQAFQPFGSAVSFNATSPKTECPFPP